MGKKFSQDEIRDLYDTDYVSRYHQKDTGRIRKILENVSVSGNDQVVDYACGNALLMEYLHDKVKHYWGVDFSEDFVRQAKKRREKAGAKNCSFYCGDIKKFANQHRDSFDKAFTLDFSEHIYDEDFIEIYQAIRVSLKEEGELVLHTPNLNFVLEWLKDKGIMKQFPEHIAVRNETRYLELLKNCGFRDIEIHYLPHYIRLLKPLHWFRTLPVFGKYMKARLLITGKK